VLEIIRDRGKVHNPVTGPGGMLLGTVREVGPESPLGLRPGDRIATLVSLTLTPLRIDEGLAGWSGGDEQIPRRGMGVLFRTVDRRSAVCRSRLSNSSRTPAWRGPARGRTTRGRDVAVADEHPDVGVGARTELADRVGVTEDGLHMGSAGGCCANASHSPSAVISSVCSWGRPSPGVGVVASPSSAKLTVQA